MIKFLATDLDGTLLTSGKIITPRSRDVLIEAQKRGLTLIIASGRPLTGIRPHAEELQLRRYHGYVISNNGSLVWDCAADKAVSEHAIPLHIVPQIAAMAGSDFLIHGYKGDSIVVGGKADQFSHYISLANKMPLIETDDFVSAITEPQHKCIITGPPRKLWHLERRLAKRFESDLTVCRSESFLLEIMPKGIDKAVALAELLRMRNGKSDELMCCGDGFNDVGMMQLAGISCATRNAKRPVREAADFITDSNDRDGVARAVERFVLSSDRGLHN